MKSSKKKTLLFPKNFLWGTATSAHQVEGNNIYSDWWEWEVNKKNFEKSAEACKQYVCYREDFKLIKDVLNNNSHRLSIEWARIEPEKGVYDTKSINHYRDVLKELKRLKVTTFVTLHHFTNPKWFMDAGGWAKKKNLVHFSSYVEVISKELGDLIDYWIVINEPNIYSGNAYITGNWLPEKHSYIKALFVYRNMAFAHKEAYRIIHENFPKAKVTSAINMMHFIPKKFLEGIAVGFFRFIFNDSFLYMTRGNNDYLAINYYFTKDIRLKDIFIKKLKVDKDKFVNAEKSDLGWPIYPKGIYEVTTEAYKKYNLPIVITENGIADQFDKKRPKFILDTLKWLHYSIKNGANIQGYIHWSLLDNYEWHIGRSARFGLFAVDYDTQKRTPRPSAFFYGNISKSNSISIT